MIRLLFLGDLVGECGRSAAKRVVGEMLREGAVDFVVVNGENAANGRGITPKIAIDLLRSGVAVITTGDHVWDQREIVPHIATEPRLLRPLNWPAGTPGAGSIVLETAKGRVGVMNVQTRTFMKDMLENPFTVARAEAERLRGEARVVLVDVHGETTSEKIALGRHLDGLVSAVVGTHTHVQTADERILPGGTAFLCDAGMCGAYDSVLGREVGVVVAKFLDGMPSKFHVAKGVAQVCGVRVDVDEESGRAVAVERVRRLVEPE